MTGEKLTPEYMRAWESRLTEEQQQYAFNLAKRYGWWPGESNPPIWVWAECFRQAERDKEAGQ